VVVAEVDVTADVGVAEVEAEVEAAASRTMDPLLRSARLVPSCTLLRERW